MQNETIMPVRHTTLSGVGATTASGLGGAIKGGLAGYGLTTLATAVVGAGALALLGPFGLIGGAALGLLGGGILGATFIAPSIGTLTSIVGAATHGSRAAHRVSQEKSAALIMDAQVAAYQGQSSPSANTTVYASPSNDNKYNFPAQGSAMNAAPSSIQASSVENQGMVNGQQRQIG